MKRLFPSLLIALASTAMVAAAPSATPAVQTDVTPATLPAPSPERLALARQYMAQSGAGERMLTMMHDGISQGAMMRFAEIESDKDRATAETTLDRLLQRLDPKLREGMPKMMEAYAQVYAREFSAVELQQLRDFATSPTGRHYMAQSLTLMSEPQLLEAQEELMGNVMPIMQDLQKQACAAKAAARVAAGDKHAKCPLAG